MPFTRRINTAYRPSRGDSIGLFRTVLSVGQEIGLSRAFDILEACVIEKRIVWLDDHLGSIERSEDPVRDGFRVIYEIYLGVSIPKGGQEIEATGRKIVSRWWNECPTLKACHAPDLDTREVCRKVYHRPVQAFLSMIDTRLRFDRNYDRLRPFSPYCEGIISLSG